MLRFNKENDVKINTWIVFQYILCYGSTFQHQFFWLNTLPFQYILCYGSTSEIHKNKGANKKFQYILCYGSTIYNLIG